MTLQLKQPATTQKQQETTVCQLTINVNEMETEKREITEQIPVEYHHHWQVFSKKTSHRYPLARDEDHHIMDSTGLCNWYSSQHRPMSEIPPLFILQPMLAGVGNAVVIHNDEWR